jgi:hypothetical protein
MPKALNPKPSATEPLNLKVRAVEVVPLIVRLLGLFQTLLLASKVVVCGLRRRI